MSRLRSTLRDLDPRTIDGPKGTLLILCLTSAAARVDEAAIGVLLPQIRADFGVNVSFIANLSAAAGLLLILGAVPFGYLADRVKRVWLLRIGTISTAATVAVTGLVGSPAGFAGARVANGLAQGVAPPASFPLITDWFAPHSRARVFGLFFAAAQLGLIAGPVTAGVLGDAIGWQKTVLLLGGFATGAALLTLLLREPVRGAFDRPDADRPPPPPPRFAEAYRSAASVSTLRRLWYATPLVGIRGLFAITLLPILLAELYGLSSTQIGLLFTVNGITQLLALLVAGSIGSWLLGSSPGRFMTFMGFAPVVQAMTIVGLSLLPPLPVAVLLIQVNVACEVISQPAGYTLLSFVVPSRIRGLGLSTTAPWQLGGLLMVPLLFSLIDEVDLRRGILVFVPLLVIGGIILITGGPGVERDIAAARAADAAEDAARAVRADGRSPLLVCRDVDVAYDGVQVLFGVDLDLLEGEVVALVGTNGAGKSTLLRAIAGTQEASGGAIVLAGRDTTHLPPHELARLGVVLMPGGAAVFPGLSVGENLQAALTTVPVADVDARLAEVRELFPVLRERWDSPAGTLSGGEQQMVGVSQALLMAPRLLLVDELSLGLAPAVVEQLLAVLRTLNARGTTVVMVEQSLNVALTIADRAVFMEKGEIRFDGAVEELLARPDLVRSVFLGGASGGTRATARSRRAPEQGDAVPAPALDVRGLRLSYGGVVALDGVDLSVAPGEVVGVVGPNGAGKTTLFDVVSGFARPDAGAVLLGGVDVTAAAPDVRARAGLGRSFQNARLFPALTVRETVATALERRAVRSPLLAAVRAPSVRRSERRIARQVDRLVDLLGLEAYADTAVGALSTGSRRAVDVACILALEPSLLLLDEPSSGLAQAETESLGPLLARIVRETGCGMVVIEHDIPLVSGLSDRLVAMAAGAVLVDGTPSQVRADPRVLSSFLAASDDVVARSGDRMAQLAGALSTTLTTPTPEQ